MSMPICNRFYAGRINSGKYELFRGYPSLTLSFEGNPLIQGHEILSQKTKVFGAAHSEYFVIIPCDVSIQSQSVTDRQTDKRLDDG